MVSMRPKGDAPSGDALIARLAGRSHGVVTRRQLLHAGLSERQVRSRIERGALIRVHRGVFRVGHAAPSREATYLAAVRACGEHAALAGRAAAHLWGLVRGSTPAPEVIAPTRHRVKGVLVHREKPLPGPIWCPDLSSRLGIPVTTVPRTLADLASSLSEPELARSCHQAQVLYRLRPEQVEAVLARRPSSPGAGVLRAILWGETPTTLSHLERAFLARLREAGLPLPETNRVAGGRVVDCRWPAHGLTVELDSYRYHGSRQAWERDRMREREAHARGDDFRRYTYGDVLERPAAMLRELRGLLVPGLGA